MFKSTITLLFIILLVAACTSTTKTVSEKKNAITTTKTLSKPAGYKFKNCKTSKISN